MTAITLRIGTQVLGSVTDALGNPIYNAQITISETNLPNDEVRQEVVSETSDSKGRFTTRGVRDGSYEVFCSAVGYVGRTHQSIEVTAGFAPEVHLVLEAGLPYEARVLTIDGEPVEGADVQIIVSFDAGGPLFESWACTDSGGYFDFQGIPVGATVIHVRTRGDRGLLARELRARGVGELQKEIFLPRDATIEIVLHAPAGHGLPKAVAVTLERIVDSAAGARTHASSRNYQVEAERVRIVGLEAGSYAMCVTVEGFRSTMVEEVEVAVGETTSLAIALGAPGILLTIVVLSPSRAPIAGARVICSFVDVPPASQDPATSLGMSDESGACAFRVPSGLAVDLTIEARGYPAEHVPRFEMTRTAMRLESVLKPAASLLVRVRDHAGNVDSSVHAELEPVDLGDRESGTLRQPRTPHLSAESGEFQFDVLSPGEYCLRLWRATVELHKSEFELSAGESKTFELSVDPAIQVHGKITINGEPVVGGKLNFISRRTGSAGTIDRLGLYGVVVAEPGEFMVRFRNEGNVALQAGPCVVAKSLELDLDFHAVRFAGEVLLPDGSPAGGVPWTLLAEDGLAKYNGRTDAAGRIALVAVCPAEYRLQAVAPAGYYAPPLKVTLHANATGTLTLERVASLRLVLPDGVIPQGVKFDMLRAGACPERAEMLERPQIDEDPLFTSWPGGVRFGYASDGVSASIFEVPAGASEVALTFERCGTVLAEFSQRVTPEHVRRRIAIEWLGRVTPVWVTTAWSSGAGKSSTPLPPGIYQARVLASTGHTAAVRFTIAAGEQTKINLD
ncbi:MAG: carboxypeptidase regulatory-like domain-containing protein [Planctomycetota bacterium]